MNEPADNSQRRGNTRRGPAVNVINAKRRMNLPTPSGAGTAAVAPEPAAGAAELPQFYVSGGDADARMAKIAEILGYAAIRLLEKVALVIEWVRHAEAKGSVDGQLVYKPKGGRPEGGLTRAARELPVPGRTFPARRKFIERAIKIDTICPEAKAAVLAAKLDNNQSALLAIASERSPEAQLVKVKELAARKAAPRRKRSAAAANLTGAEILPPNGLDGEVNNMVADSPPTAPTDGGIPDFLNRSELSPDVGRVFDDLMAMWAHASDLRLALARAPVLVRERFISEVRRPWAGRSAS